MLDSTKSIIVEISRVSDQMTFETFGVDKATFDRIHRMAEQALTNEREHERAMRDRLRNGKDL